jgi:hypothetical protein
MARKILVFSVAFAGPVRILRWREPRRLLHPKDAAPLVSLAACPFSDRHALLPRVGRLRDRRLGGAGGTDFPAGTTARGGPVRPFSHRAGRHTAVHDDAKELAMPTKRLTLQQRREIFHTLVTTQDMGLMTVAQSREHVTKQFDITDAQLRQIEEEGLDKEWPPLNEAVEKVG